MTHDEQVGAAALKHMFDRRDIQNILEDIRDSDPEVWADIVAETGRAALSAMPTPTVQEAAKVLLDAVTLGAERAFIESGCRNVFVDDDGEIDWVDFDLRSGLQALTRALSEGDPE